MTDQTLVPTMPVYKGVEVWIEDSEYRKLDYQDLSIDLVDDRTITAKADMFKNECYTVHCLSPISVFCEVFVVTSPHLRRLAARFTLEKTLVTSEHVSASSVGHTVGQFQEHGLRTPKKKVHQGRLGSIAVEIRRIGGIIKSEFQEEREADGDGVKDILVIDDFDKPPWLVFHFDIGAKESLVVPTSTPKQIKKYAPRKAHRHLVTSRNQPMARESSTTEELAGETSPEKTRCKHSRAVRRHRRHERSASTGENSVHTNTHQLQQAYQEEEAEEQRLLQLLQDRLEAKKSKNMELRRLLGECM